MKVLVGSMICSAVLFGLVSPVEAQYSLRTQDQINYLQSVASYLREAGDLTHQALVLENQEIQQSIINLGYAVCESFEYGLTPEEMSANVWEDSFGEPIEERMDKLNLSLAVNYSAASHLCSGFVHLRQ